MHPCWWRTFSDPSPTFPRHQEQNLSLGYYNQWEGLQCSRLAPPKCHLIRGSLNEKVHLSVFQSYKNPLFLWDAFNQIRIFFISSDSLTPQSLSQNQYVWTWSVFWQYSILKKNNPPTSKFIFLLLAGKSSSSSSLPSAFTLSSYCTPGTRLNNSRTSFTSSKKSSEVGAIITSILQMKKSRLREVK